jgi:hypothetical protein
VSAFTGARKTHRTPPDATKKHHQNPKPQTENPHFFSQHKQPTEKQTDPAGHPVNSLLPKIQTSKAKTKKPTNSQSKNQNNSRYAVGGGGDM